MALPALLRNWILAFVAPRPLIGLFYLPRYVRHWREFSGRAGAAAPHGPRLGQLQALRDELLDALRRLVREGEEQRPE